MHHDGRLQSSCLGAASTAAAEARAVSGSFQDQLGIIQQDMRSLQSKVRQDIGQDKSCFAVCSRRDCAD